MSGGEEGGQTLQPSESTEAEAPEVPFLFGCALWVPAAAVLLYFLMMFLRPRVSVDLPVPPEE